MNEGRKLSHFVKLAVCMFNVAQVEKVIIIRKFHSPLQNKAKGGSYNNIQFFKQ